MLQLQQRDKDILRFLEEHRGITTQQCISIFFKNDISAYRRLNQLEDAGILEHYMIGRNKVYKLSGESRQLSCHDTLIYDFYAWIYQNNGQVIEFKKNPRYLNGMLIPDALIKFKLPYEGQMYTIYSLLEIDLNHYTDNTKMNVWYEKLYREQTLKQWCGAAEYPFIIIARPTPGLRYNSKNFNCVYCDLKFTNLDRLLLS